MKDVLPKPPTGASACLSVKGEVIHDKMVIATTRQLSASTGSQYSRYTAHCTLYNGLGTLYTAQIYCKLQAMCAEDGFKKKYLEKANMECRN